MIKKIIIGIFSGIVCGLFASGGGLILVPAFVYLLKIDEKQARATSLYAILPMVIVSGSFYNNENYINWNLGIKCAIGGMIGAYIGAKLLKKLSNNILKISFIIFIIYAAIRIM